MKNLYLGIDIGSTTAKLTLLDEDHNILYGNYRRHNAEVFPVLLDMLQEIKNEHGEDLVLTVLFTGTAGMGVAERAGLPFVQEVAASAEVVKTFMPQVRTFIDLGGEDAKIIFFDENLKPDIRMNGNCAGGTGAFIDQMAALLNVPVEKLSALAAQHTACYSIASRCGVFAKTDIQNLISRDVPPSDIAASIYRAVAFQILSALARGVDVKPSLLFAGGPFSFQPALRDTFLEVVGLDISDVTIPETIDPKLTAERIPSAGAALRAKKTGKSFVLRELLELIEASRKIRMVRSQPLDPLFSSDQEFLEWEKRKNTHIIKTVGLKELDGRKAYLGIDSGSTTTKIVLIDEDGRLAYTYYSQNKGTPVDTVLTGLRELKAKLTEAAVTIDIARSAVTGYGEDLIKFAFSLDEGHVETIAHYRGARFFEPDVSFIMDIGGQDMKAIFVRDGIIQNIELNESCSSGSGSFIQTFAQSMGSPVEEFARAACSAVNPCDLGSRCTVFMNSKVKQVLREGGELRDISAGLAYSVIKNCLNKVLKLTDFDVLGDKIVVQGGTFRNLAVLRAMELVTGKSVIRPDRAELMGAWGVALMAKDHYARSEASTVFGGLDSIEAAARYEKKNTVCKGCENQCVITVMMYPDRLTDDGKTARFYTGNKCEKIFSNQIKGFHRGVDLPSIKRDLIMNRPTVKPGITPRLRIGIPRVLNMWEDYPFWNTLFVEAGFEVVLSDPSTIAMVEKGYKTVMSENICFPAKITNGHIMNLIDKEVDRIFYPKVRYTRKEFKNVLNKFNCPVVTGYPQVIESSIDPLDKYGIPFDAPAVSFHDNQLLRHRCLQYLSSLGVPKSVGARAVSSALKAAKDFKRELRRKSRDIVSTAQAEGRTVMLLMGRPYHIDAMINMKIPEIISALGFDVITEDSVPLPPQKKLPKVQVLTQWSFPNRLFSAAHWAGKQNNIEVIQMNSFGCGPDALTVDEVKSILNVYGKNPTLIKIDEMTSPGSVKLRVRSLVESIRNRQGGAYGDSIPRKETKIFTSKDRYRTVLAPQFSPFYTDFIIAAFRNQGYKIEVLPIGDRESIELGLRYSNNDICYPATIVIGDLLKALRSGRYDLNSVAVGLTQTGGQCRASSYVSLLKRALIKAGYDNIPVVTVSTKTKGSKMMNLQPGFHVRTLPFTLTALYGLIFGDVMAKLYYYSAVREKEKGSAKALVQKYIDKGKGIIDHRARKRMFALLHEAVADFNALPMHEMTATRVGIVGEIYVKFNPFGNLYTTEWLIDRGIQPEVPPLIDFFLIPLVSTPYNARNYIEEVKFSVVRAIAHAEHFIDKTFVQVNDILRQFKGSVTPFHPISKMAQQASGVIDLINQFGETWLLAGDIATFAKDGVETVVCLQPFGCIANHVIAKGVEKRMKTLYPSLNLLFLDMDSGMSEVNVANRMEFLVDGLKRDMQEEQEPLKIVNPSL